MQDTNYLRKTPLVVTGIILTALKKHFMLEDDLRYSEDNVDTKITIEPSFRWTPEACQNRPGVYVKRNAVSIGNPRAGMDDLYSYDNLLSERTYAFFMDIPFTIYCISKNPGITETIAYTCFEALTVLGPVIKKDFEFNKFIVNQIGAISQIEENKELYLIPLNLDILLNETWTLRQDAQKITGIHLDSNFSI